MSSKARAGPIPTEEYRCTCGGQRHKCDMLHIAKLEEALRQIMNMGMEVQREEHRVAREALRHE